VPGRGLTGIHYAMDFLTQQNARVAERPVPGEQAILATGKHVIVIGGGDTGSDCVGTSIRQGAASVTQLEIMPRPPEKEDKALTWPNWPLKMRTSTSHEEGCERDWAVQTRRVVGSNHVEGLELVRVEWLRENGNWQLKEDDSSAFVLPAELVLLAMGFVHPVHDALITDLGLELDSRGNVKADPDAEDDAYRTNRPKVFACGDMRRGQSLVVWAIREGRQCARSVDQALMGYSELPR
jgi:glutamate synthase (NADPH/NADH) small chain